MHWLTSQASGGDFCPDFVPWSLAAPAEAGSAVRASSSRESRAHGGRRCLARRPSALAVEGRARPQDARIEASSRSRLPTTHAAHEAQLANAAHDRRRSVRGAEPTRSSERPSEPHGVRQVEARGRAASLVQGEVDRTSCGSIVLIEGSGDGDGRPCPILAQTTAGVATFGEGLAASGAFAAGASVRGPRRGWRRPG